MSWCITLSKRRLGHITTDIAIWAHCTQLEQTSDLDLTNALTGQVEDGTDFFQCNSAPIRYIERARLAHLGEVFVREVELDAARLWIDIEK